MMIVWLDCYGRIISINGVDTYFGQVFLQRAIIYQHGKRLQWLRYCEPLQLE